MKLPWLRETWRQLLAARQQQRLAHGLAIAWQPDLGSDRLINQLVAWLLCRQPSQQACGCCKSCQLLQAGSHPDYHLLDGQAHNSLGIDSVRNLQTQLHNAAHQGGAKVAVIQQAEKLTTAAANALLKTLEEPPADTYLILSSGRSAELLPTLRSRLQFYSIALPSVDELAAWLSQHAGTPVSPRESLRSWCEKPIAALSALETGALEPTQRFAGLLNNQPLDKSMRDKDSLMALLDYIELVVRDLSWLQVGGGESSMRDQALLDSTLADALQNGALSAETLQSWQLQCYQLRRQLREQSGLNAQLGVQQLVAQIQSLQGVK